MGTKRNYDSWIASFILVLYGWVIHSILRKIAPKLLAGTVKTQSKGYSDIIKGDDDYTENISSKFEEMCIRNPLAYKDSSELKEVVDNYSKLIKGQILDPEGNHIPSLNVDGDENPDYYRYLRNQKRALDKAGHNTDWVKTEMSRYTSQKNAEAIERCFAEELIKKGLPEIFIPYALSYGRIETHTPQDWESLVTSIKTADKEGCSEESIVDFLETVETPESYEGYILSDYATLRDSGVDHLLALEFANHRISSDQAIEASYYIQRGYTAEEALTKVLEEASNKLEEQDLKNKYRSQL